MKSDVPDKAYSINQESWNYTDAGEALEALLYDDRLVDGAIYWESDIQPVHPSQYLCAGRVLERAQDHIYDDIGECSEDAFRVGREAEQELDELLKAWAEKHITGRYWVCIGTPRELRVTAADVAEYGEDHE